MQIVWLLYRIPPSEPNPPKVAIGLMDGGRCDESHHYKDEATAGVRDLSPG